MIPLKLKHSRKKKETNDNELVQNQQMVTVELSKTIKRRNSEQETENGKVQSGDEAEDEESYYQEN